MDRIVVADDHPLFRAALGSALARAAPGAAVEEVASLADARAALGRGPTDLLLLDLKMSDCDGFAGLVAIRSDWPTVPVVVVSASEDTATVRRALSFGASGFIPKSATLDAMVQALSAVLAGDTWAPELGEATEGAMEDRIATLTPAQLKILIGLQQGRLNKQIAYDLSISESTVKGHVSAILRKFEVPSRMQAVLLAQRTMFDQALGA